MANGCQKILDLLVADISKITHSL